MKAHEQRQYKYTLFVEANIMNISTKFQSFSFIPCMSSEEKIFEYVFANLAFRLPWQPIKFSGLDKIHIVGRGLLKELSAEVLSKYLQGVAINAKFHFSHYKSMAKLP